MRAWRNSALVWTAAVLVMLSGCVLKKRRPPIPQQGQAPTVTAPIPEKIPEEAETTTPPPAPPPEPAEAGKKTKPRHNAKKPPTPPAQTTPPAQAQSQPAKPGRVVIQEGSDSQPQGALTASLGAEEATHQRQSTAQLLDTTQSNLRSLTRQLSAEEQAMVTQIKDYMEQSRKAMQESDPVRAHNLALKAHLLSDELVKR